jgi:hypothetical protein
LGGGVMHEASFLQCVIVAACCTVCEETRLGRVAAACSDFGGAQPAEACLATDADGAPLLCVLCRGAAPALTAFRLPE